MGTSLFFTTPRTKDVERRPCPTNTHILYFLPAFMDVSRHRYPFVIPIPLFFCLFLSSFGYKPASRRKQISYRAESCTSLRTFPPRHPILLWLKKNIHRCTATIAQRWSSTPFTRFQRCSLTETGRWKEIFFRDWKLEKQFVRPESRRSSVVWCAVFWAGRSPVRSPSFDWRLLRISSVPCSCSFDYPLNGALTEKGDKRCVPRATSLSV